MMCSSMPQQEETCTPQKDKGLLKSLFSKKKSKKDNLSGSCSHHRLEISKPQFDNKYDIFKHDQSPSTHNLSPSNVSEQHNKSSVAPVVSEMHNMRVGESINCNTKEHLALSYPYNSTKSLKKLEKKEKDILYNNNKNCSSKWKEVKSLKDIPKKKPRNTDEQKKSALSTQTKLSKDDLKNKKNSDPGILRNSSFASILPNNTNINPLAPIKRHSSAPSAPIKRNISFSTLEIRHYEMILGDNPGGSSGPPLSLGWNYDEDQTKVLDMEDYEQTREARRKVDQLHLKPGNRIDLLLQHSNCTVREMQKASNEANEVRKIRISKPPNLKNKLKRILKK